MRRDRRAVVAEVDVGFVAGDALAGDTRALEAADQLFGLDGDHGAGDDFEQAGEWRVTSSSWLGGVNFRWHDCCRTSVSFQRRWITGGQSSVG